MTVVVVVATLLAACGSSHHRLTAQEVSGGCGVTILHRGPPPAWAAHSNPPAAITPHATATGDSAAAFIFGYPLRAGNPRGKRNKILWLLRQPGTGLIVRATPLHATTPAITVKLTDDAGFETYPSYVNVPRAGCWHLTLRWAGHTASIDLDYQ
jgi:hypothetical protein